MQVKMKILLWFLLISCLVYSIVFNFILSRNYISSTVLGQSQFRLNPYTHAYEIDGKPIIWHYWHNETEMPIYVRLLTDAIQCRNKEFRTIIVHDTTFRTYLPDVGLPDEALAFLTPVDRADFFRINIISKYGGVYMDVDTYALSPMYPLYRLLFMYDVVAPNWGADKMALGQLGPARADVPVFGLWAKAQRKNVMRQFRKTHGNNTSYPFYWSELLRGIGMPLINHQLNTSGLKMLNYDGANTVGQLVKVGLKHSALKSFDDVSAKFLPLKKTPILFWHHSGMREQFRKLNTTEEILLPDIGENTVFSVFVGCALQNCMGEYENALTEAEMDTPMTSVGRINITELLDVLHRFDFSVCEKIEQSLPWV